MLCWVRRFEGGKGGSDEKDYDFLGHASSGGILQSTPLGG
jgi:hypothetical protein